MKIKKEHIGAAVAIGVIALVGFFLFPLVTSWSIALLPVSATSVAPLVRMAILHHVVPGLAIGIILGLATALLCPVRHLALLMLPAILVFLAYMVMQLTLYPVEWNTRFVLTFFLPEWASMFIGAIGVVVIGRKRGVSSRTSDGIRQPAGKFQKPSR